jgi:hypothetical protein
VLAKGKQFLLLKRPSPCYSYIQSIRFGNQLRFFSFRHSWPILAILLRSFSFLAPKNFKLLGFSTFLL